MQHALIIDDNMAVSRAISDRLSAFGFDSFDHTWTEQQAREAVAQRRPDLIVVGDHIASGSPFDVAREVALASQAPVLAVTSEGGTFQRSLADGQELDGFYPLAELDAALASASKPARENVPPAEQQGGTFLMVTV